MIADLPARLQERTLSALTPKVLNVSFMPEYRIETFQEAYIVVRSKTCRAVAPHVAVCDWRVKLLARERVIYERRGVSSYRHGKFTLNLPALRRGLQPQHTQPRKRSGR